MLFAFPPKSAKFMHGNVPERLRRGCFSLVEGGESIRFIPGRRKVLNKLLTDS